MNLVFTTQRLVLKLINKIYVQSKSFTSKRTDTFAYNSNSSILEEPILLHNVLDGTCTMIEEE